MSKRYIIQVNVGTVESPEWVDYQFDNSGGAPWMTRSRSTAIADAAKLKHEGETRELRVVESRPVFELVEIGVGNDEIMAAHEVINWADESDYDDDDDDELTETLEAQVGEVPAGDDETPYFLK